MQGVNHVSDSLTAHGTTWDSEKITRMFKQDDALDIKQISIGGSGMEDYIAWYHTKRLFLG